MMSPIETNRENRSGWSTRLPNWSNIRAKNLALFRKNKWMVTGIMALLVMVIIPVASASLIYTVQPGDTLFKIAQRYGTTVEYLAARNGILNPDHIIVGQHIDVAAPVVVETTTTTTTTTETVTTETVTTAAHAVAPVHSVHGTGHYTHPSNHYTYPSAHYVSPTNYAHHTVVYGDTLHNIAHRYGIPVYTLQTVNSLPYAHTIYVGQVLLIPHSTVVFPGYQTVHPQVAVDHVHPTSLPILPNTPATAEVNPEVNSKQACTRFNFAEGRDAVRGAVEGTFIMLENTAGEIATWNAGPGATDSGWINGLNITYDSVYVTVMFYPKYGGGAPVQMEIVNPAGGTSYGWLSDGTCHAVEIQYPLGY